MQFSEKEIENIIQEEMLNILKERSTTPIEHSTNEEFNFSGPTYSNEVDEETAIVIGYDYKG